jgi:hypothetical protein
MSNTVKPSKAKTLADVQALIAGTQKHFPNQSLTVGNATLSSTSLIALLQSLIDAMTKQSEAKASSKDATSALRVVELQVNPMIQVYKGLLTAMFAGASQTLEDFGLAPRKKRAPMTAEQKALAAAKARATRKARGTLGPKAKLAIKGTVAAPAEQPVAPAPAPAKPAG